MIPNKDQMNKTLPTNTGGGLGFVEKSPSPRPAPRELIQPSSQVSNASLLNGTPNYGMGGLGYSANVPSNMSPAMVAPRQVPMGAMVPPKKRNWPVLIGIGSLIIGTGWVIASKFDSSDLKAEEGDF